MAIKSHLYLSELMRPWFYFAYMEAKRLPETRKRDAVAMELETEGIYRDILDKGIRCGTFRNIDAHLLASLLKAMLPD